MSATGPCVLTDPYGPFGVVAGVLDTLHDLRLVCLIRIGEFFDALYVSLRDWRKPLIISRLPGAVRRDFLLVAFKFIERSLANRQSTFRHEYPQCSTSKCRTVATHWMNFGNLRIWRLGRDAPLQFRPGPHSSPAQASITRPQD
jgi:hypothetical protein